MNRTSELLTFHDKFLLPETKRKPVTRSPPAPAPDADHERFQHMGLACDRVFAALWEGGRRNGNKSADDQALMNQLAY